MQKCARVALMSTGESEPDIFLLVVRHSGALTSNDNVTLILSGCNGYSFLLRS